MNIDGIPARTAINSMSPPKPDLHSTIRYICAMTQLEIAENLVAGSPSCTDCLGLLHLLQEMELWLKSKNFQY